MTATLIGLSLGIPIGAVVMLAIATWLRPHPRDTRTPWPPPPEHRR